MDSWFSLSLGDGMMAGSPSAEIEDAFAQAFAQAGEPAAMAVFTRPESEGRLYCEVIAYFPRRQNRSPWNSMPSRADSRFELD